MILLSVCEEKNGRSGFINVPASDVIFVQAHDNSILVHLPDRNYFSFGTLQQWLDSLRGSGLTFEQTDRPFIANLSFVTNIDREWGKLYFVGGKYVTVSMKYRKLGIYEKAEYYMKKSGLL